MHKASQKLIYFDVNILVFGIQWHNGYFGDKEWRSDSSTREN